MAHLAIAQTAAAQTAAQATSISIRFSGVVYNQCETGDRTQAASLETGSACAVQREQIQLERSPLEPLVSEPFQGEAAFELATLEVTEGLEMGQVVIETSALAQPFKEALDPSQSQITSVQRITVVPR